MAIASSAAATAALLAGGLVVIRYVTFDPKLFVAEVEERLNPLRPAALDPSRAPGASTNARATPLLPPQSSDPAERVREHERTTRALRHEYHTSTGPCFRYPTKEDVTTTTEGAEAAVDALLAANLVGRVEALVPAAARWTLEADTAAHRSSADEEVVEHFAKEAGLWTRLGVALHRGAIRDAAAVALQPRLPPSASDAPLSAEEEARAKPIWERFGYSQLLQGAMRVPLRMHMVDLRVPRLRLVEPGMSQSDVRARLGAAEEDGTRWRYRRFGTEVTFDERGSVVGIASALAPGDQVVVDGIPQRDLVETSMARVLGKPLRDGQTDAGEAVLVYGLGDQALLLVFARQLVRVELWRKELVLPAAH